MGTFTPTLVCSMTVDIAAKVAACNANLSIWSVECGLNTIHHKAIIHHYYSAMHLKAKNKSFVVEICTILLAAEALVNIKLSSGRCSDRSDYTAVLTVT